MRRPDELRRHAMLGASAAIGFAVLMAYLVHRLLGGVGRLGFGDTNPAGFMEMAVFVATFMTALSWCRSALRLPGPVLLSFGVVAPPAARKVAEAVPLVDVATAQHMLADHRVLVVVDNQLPVGMSGVRRGRITPWEEVAKVPGDVSVTDLRSLLAREPLVVVVDGQQVLGVVTQEAYLAGLWGRNR